MNLTWIKLFLFTRERHMNQVLSDGSPHKMKCLHEHDDFDCETNVFGCK